MNIVVLLRSVPDLVEELEIDASGKALDATWLKYRMNEFDEHALEQALLLKEAHGGTVTAVGLDVGDADEMLFTCLAKGADRAVKVTGDFGQRLPGRRQAAILAAAVGDIGADLVLTGVQGVDDLDGQTGVYVAAELGWPHVGVVTGVSPEGGRAVVVRKELAGGVVAEIEADLPAVLGIQAADQPPRYVPVSRLRQVMRQAAVEEVAAPAGAAAGPRGGPGRTGPELTRLYKPEGGRRAHMLEGDTDAIVGGIVTILREKGVVKA